MEVQHLKVVWRFAGMRPGALYVMDCGRDLMHKWPVDSLVTQQLVRIVPIIETAVLLSQCIFFMCIIRIYQLLQCLLWTRIWSHPPG